MSQFPQKIKVLSKPMPNKHLQIELPTNEEIQKRQNLLNMSENDLIQNVVAKSKMNAITN